MKKLHSLMVILPALSLWGCGGGEGGGSSQPVAKYNFSFVALYETERNTLPAECAIFDSRPIYKENEDSDDKVIDKYSLVLAARSETNNLKVLIHDKTGKVIQEYAPGSSSWTNSGLSFPQSQVPSNGYITISYQTTRQGSGTALVDAVTYHKSLLTSTMQFSTLARPVSEALSSCIKESRTSFAKRKQSIDDRGDARGVFAFNTPEQNYWSLSPLNVDLEISSKPLLAVRYESLPTDNRENINSSFSQEQYRKLEEYRIVATRELGSRPIELNSVGDKSNDDFPLWSYSDTSASLNSAQLWVRHSNNAYFWQSLPKSGSVTFSYASDFARNYVLKTQGTNQGWSFVHNARLDGSEDWNQRPQDGINYNFVINDISKPSANPVQTFPCRTSECESGRYLEAYLGDADKKYTLQRNFLLVENGPGQQIRQVIYTPPTRQVILPSYANGMIDGLWSGNIALSQIDLVQGNQNVRRAFLRKYSDPVKQAKNIFELDPNVDGLGLIATLDTKQKDLSLIGTESYLLLSK